MGYSYLHSRGELSSTHLDQILGLVCAFFRSMVSKASMTILVTTGNSREPIAKPENCLQNFSTILAKFGDWLFRANNSLMMFTESTIRSRH